MNWGTVIKVLAVATITFFAGAAVFFGWASGFGGLAMSPLLAIFGIYFWVPICTLVIVLWSVFNPNRRNWLYRLAFVLGSIALGYVASLPLGGFATPDLVEGLRITCMLSGGIAACLVLQLKREQETGE